MSEETRQNEWRGLVDRKQVEAPHPSPPSNFIAGRPEAALLFWFFGDFIRSGVPLFITILVIYKYKNRYKKMFNVRLAGVHLYGKWLFTWLSLVMSLVASFFVPSFFPRDVLDEICDLIESVSDGFPTFFSPHIKSNLYFRNVYLYIKNESYPCNFSSIF